MIQFILRNMKNVFIFEKFSRMVIKYNVVWAILDGPFNQISLQSFGTDHWPGTLEGTSLILITFYSDPYIDLTNPVGFWNPKYVLLVANECFLNQ